ncbi:hypothetical protein CFSAN001921_15615 [Salmonella enterica subsp. enterica serovar Typhimurium var. 5- str. CFSAN001921]|nr:replication protein [Salmonella enterica]AGQ70728.1 hypothetical protein CFSAN001921_15615 [Salmonella enterica subsp. enterica serovar Typhimurium var. 5- str. CFSAN001921]
MSNLATVTPIKPHLEVVEHRVAELDDGYTRTANTLLEAVMLSGLTQHQLLIVMAVWRKTYVSVNRPPYVAIRQELVT